MSVQSEIDRINTNVQSTLSTIADTGVEVGTNSDALPSAASALANEKANVSHTHVMADITDFSGGGIPVVTTAGTGAAYTATVDGITDLYNGLTLILITHTRSTTYAPTFNLNGLGKKPLKRLMADDSSGTASGSSTDWLYASVPILISYSEPHSAWIIHTMPKTYAKDILGAVPVTSGGIGKQSLTSGSYLVGNGTAAVQLKTPAEVREDIGAIYTVTYGTTTYAEARAAVLAGQMLIIRSGTTIGVCVQAPTSETDTTQFVFLIQHSTNGGDYYVLTSSDSYAYYRKSWLPITGGTLTGALVAQNNTNYTTKQVRNVTISTADPTASDGDNGDIWIVYEATT